MLCSWCCVDELDLAQTPHLASQLQLGHGEREHGRNEPGNGDWCQIAHGPVAHNGLDFSLNTLRSLYRFVSSMFYPLTSSKQKTVFCNIYFYSFQMHWVEWVLCAVMSCPAPGFKLKHSFSWLREVLVAGVTLLCPSHLPGRSMHFQSFTPWYLLFSL